MNIQSTAVRPAQGQRARLGEDFKEKKESFLQISNDHFDRSLTYDTWGTRIGFSLGAGVLAAGGYAMYKFLPQAEGYAGAFPPVFAAAGTVGAAFWITKKLLEKELEKADFQQSRQDLVKVRDEYRDALLQEVNDPGVTEIVDKRWNGLKQYEDTGSRFPTGLEIELLQQVEDLEFLADQRVDGPGWMKPLAHAQDDPERFRNEAQTVVRNPGIHKVMTDSLGGQK